MIEKDIIVNEILKEYIDNQMKKLNFKNGIYDEDKNEYLLNGINKHIKETPKPIIKELFKHPWLELFYKLSEKYSFIYRKLFMQSSKYHDIILNSMIKWMIYYDNLSFDKYLNFCIYQNDYIKLENGLHKPSIILLGRSYYRVYKNIDTFKSNILVEKAKEDYEIYKRNKLNTPSEIIKSYKKAHSQVIKRYILDCLYKLFIKTEDKKVEINYIDILENKDFIIEMLKISFEDKDFDSYYDLYNLILGIFFYADNENLKDLKEYFAKKLYLTS